MAEQLRIGEVAKRAAVRIDTLRYYERHRLLRRLSHHGEWILEFNRISSQVRRALSVFRWLKT
jgi:DNA-binding transcriptional MerR regulator